VEKPISGDKKCALRNRFSRFAIVRGRRQIACGRSATNLENDVCHSCWCAAEIFDFDRHLNLAVLMNGKATFMRHLHIGTFSVFAANSSIGDNGLGRPPQGDRGQAKDYGEERNYESGSGLDSVTVPVDPYAEASEKGRAFFITVGVLLLFACCYGWLAFHLTRRRNK
jgi:hypothetical protein